MRRSIARVVGWAVFAALLFNGVAFATDATQPCSLYIPVIVGIDIRDTVSIHLSSSLVTDTIWPKYESPTLPASSPYSFVWYWSNGASGARVSVKGSGNWSTDILLGQLYHATSGTAKTSDGTANPAAPWVQFTTSSVAFDSTTAPGSKHADRDYEFKWEVTDPSYTGSPITITYTVTAR